VGGAALDALVPDVHFRGAVAGVRGLGRAGLGVLAVGPTPAAAGLWSRHARARAVAPEVSRHPESFARELFVLAERHGPLAIYPSREETVDVLLASSQRAPREATIPYPGPGPVAVLRDKARLPDLARAHGLGAPHMYFHGEAAGLAGAGLPFPFLLKPPVKGAVLDYPRVVESPADLEPIVAALPPRERVIAQERVAGELMSLVLVIARDGRVAARFQQRACRTWPPGAGPSTLARSVPLDYGLIERSRALLADVGYWGLAQLQFVDSRPEPALIDVNVRYYGSLPLALRSGVNLPAILHGVTMGREAAEPPPYRAGVTYRWLENELVAALHGHLRALVPPPGRPRVGAMWARDDPVPGLLLGASALGRWLRRRLPGRSGRAG
jgi:predicted ATP-grasp superfamily ATP-dependent carboligase